MAVIKLSKDAALKAKSLTRDAYMDLEANNKRLNDEITGAFQNLRDKPSTKKYAEMMSEIQALMNQIRVNFDAINEHCDRVIRWIDEYNSF